MNFIIFIFDQVFNFYIKCNKCFFRYLFYYYIFIDMFSTKSHLIIFHIGNSAVPIYTYECMSMQFSYNLCWIFYFITNAINTLVAIIFHRFVWRIYISSVASHSIVYAQQLLLYRRRY